MSADVEGGGWEEDCEGSAGAKSSQDPDSEEGEMQIFQSPPCKIFVIDV